jgi:hypothetical protein
LPYQVTLKIEDVFELGDNVDEILLNLKNVNTRKIQLSRFEMEMLDDTLANI